MVEHLQFWIMWPQLSLNHSLHLGPQLANAILERLVKDGVPGMVPVPPAPPPSDECLTVCPSTVKSRGSRDADLASGKGA
jgi:hypothetical protein